MEKTIQEIRDDIAAVKRELYQHHAFTEEWNAIARKLWALEDKLPENQATLQVMRQRGIPGF